jgi:hypothetical protein
MKYLILLAINLLLIQYDYAQTLPLIRANSEKVDILDGRVFQKGIWNLSPEAKPDVYQVLEPVVRKRITFYTDTDSVSFEVAPGNIYDFLIVLNKKDTCYTRISATTSASLNAPDKAPDGLIAAGLLKADFRVFREALEKNHAGLYTYKSKQELDHILDSCYQTLSKSMSPLEFGKPILQMISAIQDGHTGSNVPRLLMAHYNEHEKVFPLYLYFVNDKAYVLCGEGLAAGTEILTIDGRPVDNLAREIYRYLPSDGAITSKKRQQLNDGAFPILYHWIFGHRDTFEVQYKGQSGITEMSKLSAIATSDFTCDYQKKQNNARPLQITFQDNATAVLTVKTFDNGRISRANMDFRLFLDSAFAVLQNRKIANLIVDVRDNGGGDDNYGALLYSYLSQKPFRYFASKASNTHSLTPDENPLLGMQKPQQNNFKGKVYILTNGVSFSTTADFCATARSNKRAIFVGEETGGGYYGNTSGGRTEVTLPNSGIVVNIPLYKYLNAVEKAQQPDRGIIPDYPVYAKIDDILTHKDVELAMALWLIRQ